MPIDIMRIASDKIILVCVYGSITLPDVDQASQQIQAFLDEAHETTHLLAQVENLTDFPSSVQEVASVLGERAHPHLGWIIACGLNSTLVFMLSILAQRTGTKFRLFNQLEHGILFLKEMDETLC